MKAEYIIKHNDINVCIVSFTGNFRVDKVHQVLSPAHLPPYVLHSNEQDMYSFDEWYTSRAISSNREGIQEILQKYDVKSTRELLLKNYALSLYDHYWICPANENLKWKDVNFFDNKFKDDAGNILIGDFSNNKIDGTTPESSSGGMLPKKWVWRDSQTYLLKRGSGYYQQEPFNEVIISKIMQQLGINGVEYALEWKGDKPQSCCKNMLNGENELVHAWDIVHEIKVGDDKYTAFLNMAKNAGIPHVREELDKTLALDYIIANTDRHFNNIGFLRDSHTLEYSGLAPVYDSGTSLWHDKDADGIREEKSCKSKPFKSHHRDQIKKISDLQWFNPKSLGDIDEIIHDGLKDNKKIDQNKLFAITNKVYQRIKIIQRLKHDLSEKRQYDGYGR